MKVELILKPETVIEYQFLDEVLAVLNKRLSDHAAAKAAPAEAAAADPPLAASKKNIPAEITAEMLAEAMSTYCEARGGKALRSVLDELGVQKLGDIPETQFAAAYAAVQTQ